MPACTCKFTPQRAHDALSFSGSGTAEFQTMRIYMPAERSTSSSRSAKRASMELRFDTTSVCTSGGDLCVHQVVRSPGRRSRFFVMFLAMTSPTRASVLWPCQVSLSLT